MATVLLVDDDVDVLQYVAACLKGSGYSVLCACDGKEALDAAGGYQDEIQLLVSDIQMTPGMSGFDLARRLLAQRPQMRVLLMSGLDCEAAARNEGWQFIGKPFASQELNRTILGLMGAPPTSVEYSRHAA